MNGNKDVAELLLGHKVEVNAKDNHDDTPLHVPVGHRHKEDSASLNDPLSGIEDRRSAQHKPE